MWSRVKKINVQEGINVQARKYLKINKRTGLNKDRTGGNFARKNKRTCTFIRDSRVVSSVISINRQDNSGKGRNPGAGPELLKFVCDVSIFPSTYTLSSGLFPLSFTFLVYVLVALVWCC